jgi:hypothetical protein
MIRIDGRAIGCGGGFAPNTIIENFKSATLMKKKIPSIQISRGQGNECGGCRSTDYYFENVLVEGLGEDPAEEDSQSTPGHRSPWNQGNAGDIEILVRTRSTSSTLMAESET